MHIPFGNLISWKIPEFISNSKSFLRHELWGPEESRFCSSAKHLCDDLFFLKVHTLKYIISVTN